MPSLSASLALLSQLFLGALAADKEAWKSRSIYFAVTDRIARSADDTGGDACGDLSTYCGGTFAGLESKLDYIAGMGFDAIWITPVVTNSAGGYHGYWAQDPRGINENFGTADDLKSLVSAAHAKGIYIMIDVVANHMGNAAITDNSPEPMNQQSSYHSQCEINYSDQNSVENCWIAGLPDVNTQSEDIRSFYQEWISWLVTEYEFDGVRIDTVKHVEREFWTPFSAAAGVYTIGEVFDGDINYLAGYADTMDGLLNYAIYYPMSNFYQQKGSVGDFVSMHDQVTSVFPDPSALGTFLDNHDNNRWLNLKGDVALLKNALAYVVLGRGVPIVYYGTEQGFAGGADPANREDLWRSRFSTDSDLYTAIAKLNGARKSAGGLGGDDHSHLYQADTAYAWSRAGGNLIVLTTNSGSGSSGQHCFTAPIQNGQWTDVFGSASYTSDGSGQLCINVTDGAPAVLVADSA